MNIMPENKDQSIEGVKIVLIYFNAGPCRRVWGEEL